MIVTVVFEGLPIVTPAVIPVITALKVSSHSTIVSAVMLYETQSILMCAGIVTCGPGNSLKSLPSVE